MFNRTAIMKAAHAMTRKALAWRSGKPAYAKVFAEMLRFAWADAKETQGKTPAQIRLAALNSQILSEECRPRMNFALVAQLRAEAAQLAA